MLKLLCLGLTTECCPEAVWKMKNKGWLSSVLYLLHLAIPSSRVTGHCKQTNWTHQVFKHKPCEIKATKQSRLRGHSVYFFIFKFWFSGFVFKNEVKKGYLLTTFPDAAEHGAQKGCTQQVTLPSVTIS